MIEYTYTESKIPNGNVIKYKVAPSGTAYHYDTPDDLVALLERFRASGKRLRFYFGDRNTGKDWEEMYDVLGTIGRSTGRIQVPLLISNSRSTGGGALLTDSIVKLEYANKKDGGVIWQHPKYHRGNDPMATRTRYKVSNKSSGSRSRSRPMSTLGTSR